MPRFRHSLALFKRLLLALFVFELARFLFFIINFKGFWPMGGSQILSSFYYGLLFDLSALAYFNIVFVIFSIVPLASRERAGYQTTLKWIFIICNFLAFVLNTIDSVYYEFSGKRTGFELFKTDANISELWGQYFLSYWYFLVPLAFILWILWRFYPILKDSAKASYNYKDYSIETVSMVLLAGIWVVIARGGFYLKPIRPFDATKFVKAEMIPLTINTPFQIISTVENKSVVIPKYYPKEKLVEFPFKKNYSSQEGFQKKNIVIIILESIGKEYVGYYNNGKGYTPFLDSLATKSIVFNNAFSNGKKSIEALPSIISSLPSILEGAFINSPYQTNRITSIGEILQNEGYQTAFYHGARNGTMGFDGFVSVSGFGSYFGLDEYPLTNQSDMSQWGIDDEPYLQYFNQELSKTTQPFCASIFTLSSHHPYTIPSQYQEKFPKGTEPIHESVGYADYALKKFFESAQKEDWYKNTVFVITADHSAVNRKPEYLSPAGKYSIPTLLFDPHAASGKRIDKAMGHVDIVPTLFDYIHYNKPIFSMGQSALDSAQQGIVVHFDNGIYQLINLPHVLHFDGSKTIGVYNFINDPEMKYNLLEIKPMDVVSDLEDQIKLYIQFYYTSLLENRLEGN